MKIQQRSGGQVVVKDGRKGSVILGGFLGLCGGVFVCFLTGALQLKFSCGQTFILIFAIGVLMASLISTSIALTIDKSAGKLFYRRSSIVKKNSESYPLDDAVSVKLKTSRGGRFHNTDFVQCVLSLKHGELALESRKRWQRYDRSDKPRGRREQLLIAEEIAAALNVPLNNVAQP
jgi:hypothetical protein